MLKKLLLFFIAVIALTACDDELKYTGDERVLYQGRITDANGSPLQGVPVSVYISKDGYSGLYYNPISDTDIISYTTTDAGGNYKMFYPAPRNQNNIALLVNYQNAYNPQNTTYSSTSFQNLIPENLSDNKLDFEDIKLFEVANATTLSININNAGGYAISKLNLVGLIDKNEVDYNFNLPLEDENYNYQESYLVAKNQTVTLKYQTRTYINDNTLISNHEVQIPIGSEPVNYTLEF
ncbi:carboxypeptidase-like regulatory domain-containing protein [Flavobacterium subsaxonicum]|uniref:Lipoprotein n=1 Tax=Flavobacterium subsaxonicum WB 4.1-42 = DSM 21790 TaxID=1121898 RepID=A0A0A2MU50_9FLAO|nr:carboxypeptidase-like regulatory domain-containing protein [Flavobacterium subsaxonicum]KGO95136.1 hypothetical protein Q766_03300 [Flavobacterium subsaxonicum WB 4.1-42 = DSM 21790]